MTGSITKRSVGRPKTITDMRAYKAAKAREYRAKRAAIKANTTIPKPNTTEQKVKTERGRKNKREKARLSDVE